MLFSLSSLPSCLSLLLLTPPSTAYIPLSNSFLHAIPPPTPSLNPQNSTLLSPLLHPGIPAQQHFASYFATHLPEWTLSWQNSTSQIRGAQIPVANMIFKREPPWVTKGQANLLTLAAHYDSTNVRVSGNAACAVLMYVAAVLDGHVSRMYDEMAALGEGGEWAMDMGVQIVFMDGGYGARYVIFSHFYLLPDSIQFSLLSSVLESREITVHMLIHSITCHRSLATHWSTTPNPPSHHFHTSPTPLHQISLLVHLDALGTPNPTVPSYFPTTHWAYTRLATLEFRMRGLEILDSVPDVPFLADGNGELGASVSGRGGGGVFSRMGVDVLWVSGDRGEGGVLDEGTVGDWGRVLAGFGLEWLDMMEVWDEPGEGRRGRRRRR